MPWEISIKPYKNAIFPKKSVINVFIQFKKLYDDKVLLLYNDELYFRIQFKILIGNNTKI